MLVLLTKSLKCLLTQGSILKVVTVTPLSVIALLSGALFFLPTESAHSSSSGRDIQWPELSGVQ